MRLTAVLFVSNSYPALDILGPVVLISVRMLLGLINESRTKLYVNARPCPTIVKCNYTRHPAPRSCNEVFLMVWTCDSELHLLRHIEQQKQARTVSNYLCRPFLS